MPANSQRQELGASYALAILAAETTFLIQTIGPQPVRVVAVASGSSAPANTSSDYFVIESTRGASDALIRLGLEGADIYVRSDSDQKPAYITKSPS
mgnify:CR=1 FL=1